MVIRTAVTQTAIGLAIGLPLSLFAGHLLQHSLFETSALQPLVLLSVIALLAAATLAAAWLPARRASAVDPMRALRSE